LVEVRDQETGPDVEQGLQRTGTATDGSGPTTKGPDRDGMTRIGTNANPMHTTRVREPPTARTTPVIDGALHRRSGRADPDAEVPRFGTPQGTTLWVTRAVGPFGAQDQAGPFEAHQSVLPCRRVQPHPLPRRMARLRAD
jgi:hypothetical protein